MDDKKSFKYSKEEGERKGDCSPSFDNLADGGNNSSALQNGQGVKKRRTRLSPRMRRLGAIALAVLFSATLFFAGWFAKYLSIDKRMRELIWAVDRADRYYFGGIDKDGLYDEMFFDFNAKLDAYSRYYSREEYQTLKAESKGRNTGIGATFLSLQGESGIARIYSVVGNSPADVAGLKRGDYLFSYGASSVEQTAEGGLDGLVSFLSSRTEESVLVCGSKPDGSDAKEFRVKRQAYLASYVSYRDGEAGFAFRGSEKLELSQVGAPLLGLPSDTAYICIDGFNGKADEEFEACLTLMKERGKRNLVLDLRNNGGGYMDVLERISAFLLKDAKRNRAVVAVAREADGKEEKFRARGNEYGEYFSEQSKITVLANENTASASECLIGAMLDYQTVALSDVILQKSDEGVDGRTFGKGIMQTHYGNASGSVMKLTTAAVHWPISDTCIHGVGITQSSGAKAIVAPLLDGEDTFLSAVVSQIA